MDLGLRNQVVLVTAGAKGIGAAISETFVLEGAHVLMTCRSQREKAEAYADELNQSGPGTAMIVQGDISDQEAVKNWFDTAEEKYGEKVHILINNAAPLQMENREIKDMDLAFFHQQVLPGVKGLVLVSQEFLKRLVPTKERGFIVNLGSKAGISPTSGGQAAYAALKGAVHGMTRHLAEEICQYHINVNEALPGFVYNSKFREIKEKDPVCWEENYESKARNRSYTGKFLDPYYLGTGCAFLSSEASGCCVGCALDCTGGRMV